MAVIKELSELIEADRGSFGTKAVNLGVVTRLGLRVPAGFAVSSEVYEAVLAEVDTGVAPQASAWPAPPLPVRPPPAVSSGV